MISPIRVGNKVRFMTRSGNTDTGDVSCCESTHQISALNEYVMTTKHSQFAEYIISTKRTPVFEFIKSQKDTRLILLAIRDNKTGIN
jgi:hypothetical protein